MRIVFIFIINYNLKGEFKMGKIQDYYTRELDRLTEDVKLDSFQKNLEQNTSGRKKMSELRGLFESKLQEADKFKSIITKVSKV